MARLISPTHGGMFMCVPFHWASRSVYKKTPRIGAESRIRKKILKGCYWGSTEKVRPHVTKYLHLPDMVIGPAFRTLYPKRRIHSPQGFDPSGYFFI